MTDITIIGVPYRRRPQSAHDLIQGQSSITALPPFRFNRATAEWRFEQALSRVPSIPDQVVRNPLTRERPTSELQIRCTPPPINLTLDHVIPQIYT